MVLSSGRYGSPWMPGSEPSARSAQGLSLVAMIRELQRDGYSTRGIAVELDNRKVPTARMAPATGQARRAAARCYLIGFQGACHGAAVAHTSRAATNKNKKGKSMRLYAVRDKGDQSPVGLFMAESIDALAIEVDRLCDPADCE